MRMCALLLGLVALRGGAPAFAQESPARFNVLFVSIDDLRCNLGCYGDPLAKTPNLDKLADAGVRFERAYCQYPVCWASRASILMGRYPTTRGMVEHNDSFRDELSAVVTLPQHFRQNGYATARGGKIFHHGEDGARAWEQVITGPHVADPPRDGRRASDRWEAVDGEGENLVDYQTASRAIEYLERPHDKPFFLAVGFLRPHGPFVAPRKYFVGYDPRDIPLPADFAPVPTLLPGAPAEARPGNYEIFSLREASEPEAREMIAAYHACTSFMDAQVGRVLDALDRLELRHKTIVVLFSDHGFQLGEKGIWSKHGSLYDVNLHVPMIFDVPGAAGHGRACGRTVELVDLYPTLSELCGLPSPRGLEGQSLAPLLQDPQAAWEHAAYSLVKRGALNEPELVVGRSVRTERWRYTEWDHSLEIGDGKQAELYDHELDPLERRNALTDPANAATVTELRQLLRTSSLKQLAAADASTSAVKASHETAVARRVLFDDDFETGFSARWTTPRTAEMWAQDWVSLVPTEGRNGSSGVRLRSSINRPVHAVIGDFADPSPFSQEKRLVVETDVNVSPENQLKVGLFVKGHYFLPSAKAADDGQDPSLYSNGYAFVVCPPGATQLPHNVWLIRKCEEGGLHAKCGRLMKEQGDRYVAGATHDIEPGRWYRLRLEIDGLKFTGSIDGQQVVEFEETSNFYARDQHHVALYVHRNNHKPDEDDYEGDIYHKSHIGAAVFDNVAVSSGMSP